ncbi:unnamed protein product [Amoebophrya sp. A25]|nr:unnamed protein product [Amoebophrya sp. A25]|eukprot:GSA25T00022633001.1
MMSECPASKDSLVSGCDMASNTSMRPLGGAFSPISASSPVDGEDGDGRLAIHRHGSESTSVQVEIDDDENYVSNEPEEIFGGNAAPPVGETSTTTSQIYASNKLFYSFPDEVADDQDDRDGDAKNATANKTAEEDLAAISAASMSEYFGNKSNSMVVNSSLVDQKLLASNFAEQDMSRSNIGHQDQFYRQEQNLEPFNATAQLDTSTNHFISALSAADVDADATAISLVRKIAAIPGSEAPTPAADGKRKPVVNSSGGVRHLTASGGKTGQTSGQASSKKGSTATTRVPGSTATSKSWSNATGCMQGGASSSKIRTGAPSSFQGRFSAPGVTASKTSAASLSGRRGFEPPSRKASSSASTTVRTKSAATNILDRGGSRSSVGSRTVSQQAVSVGRQRAASMGSTAVLTKELRSTSIGTSSSTQKKTKSNATINNASTSEPETLDPLASDASAIKKQSASDSTRRTKSSSSRTNSRGAGVAPIGSSTTSTEADSDAARAASLEGVLGPLVLRDCSIGQYISQIDTEFSQMRSMLALEEESFELWLEESNREVKLLESDLQEKTEVLRAEEERFTKVKHVRDEQTEAMRSLLLRYERVKTEVERLEMRSEVLDAEYKEVHRESVYKQSKRALLKREVSGREAARRARDEEQDRICTVVKAELERFVALREEAERDWAAKKARLGAELSGVELSIRDAEMELEVNVREKSRQADDAFADRKREIATEAKQAKMEKGNLIKNLLAETEKNKQLQIECR